MKASTICQAFLSILALSTSTFAAAAPIQYHVTMTGSSATPHLLAGATLELIATVNVAAETRLVQKEDGFSRHTVWSSFNSTTSLKVTGSSSSDGSYVGEVNASFTTGWLYGDSHSNQGDLMQFPSLTFDVHGKSIQFSNLTAIFGDDQFQGTGNILPKPFSASDANWMLATIRTTSPREEIKGLGVSGFAIAVPEPSAITLAGFPFIGLAALSRRR